jgi:hypothetical protein
MDVFVQLNDVFDVTSPSIFEHRINIAFETNGTNFWECFFLCKNLNIDDKNEEIVYLFTEYQLSILWKWWDKKLKESDADTKKKLKYSKQKIKEVKLTSDGKCIDSLHACYIKYNHGYQYGGITPVFFGMSPPEKSIKNKDFFDGGFGGESLNIKITTEDERKQVFLSLLSNRKEIEKEFGRPKKNEKKWMRYLGFKIPSNKAVDETIDYCINPERCPKKDTCPFSGMLNNIIASFSSVS